MKKILLCLVFVFIFLFAAQEKVRGADYATSYQTYVSSSGDYQIKHNSYLTARANYLASGSLDSQDRAKSATLVMLASRDALIENYLSAINEKIKSTSGITDTDKSTFAGQITSEISWYIAHSSRLASAGSLDDSVNDSNEAKDRYNQITQTMIYQSLITIGVGQNTHIRDGIVSKIGDLNAKIAEIKSNQDKDVSLIERSIIDVQNKLSRSQDKDNTAINLVNSIKPSLSGTSSAFVNAQTAVSDSYSYLKEANQSLLQVITQIKTN